MPRFSTLAAVLLFCCTSLGTRSLRAEVPPPSPQVATTGDEPIKEIVITGSLIPQARAATVMTTTTISAADMQERGFATVADALQQSAFSSGSVQGAQFTGNVTPGAQTLSLFGLSPSDVKYLVDGRPMSDYPALYNGSDTITNIGGIRKHL